MNRLPIELDRLYPMHGPVADGHVRACVLQLSAPADWQALSAVWKGVQADLELPAPAIAVTGTDGFQLWFSLAQSLPVQQAQEFLLALQARYLQHVRSERVTLLTTLDAAALPPALQASNGMWSAFIAPDLAPVMSDEPWLDLPPNPDGQASLLARLLSSQPAALLRAIAQLQAAALPPIAAVDQPPRNAPDAAPGCRDPRGFLLDVMSDRSVDLALRIEAAKALLRDGDGMGKP